MGTPLDPRPFKDLSGKEQLELKRIDDFVHAWNETAKQGRPPDGTPIHRRSDIPWSRQKRREPGRPEDMTP